VPELEPILSSSEQLYLYGEPLTSNELQQKAPRLFLPPKLLLQQQQGKDHESDKSAAITLTSRLLWVAVSGNCSTLHFDLSEGLLGMVSGEKRCVLFAPQCGEHLEPYATSHEHDRQSQINCIHRPDLKRHPGFRGVAGVQLVLRPGDVLYLPYGWWHQIESSGESISVSHRFNPYEDAIRAVMLVRARAVAAGLPPGLVDSLFAQCLQTAENLPPHIADCLRRRYTSSSAAAAAAAAAAAGKQ
jgi:hypothetical protein